MNNIDFKTHVCPLLGKNDQEAIEYILSHKEDVISFTGFDDHVFRLRPCEYLGKSVIMDRPGVLKHVCVICKKYGIIAPSNDTWWCHGLLNTFENNEITVYGKHQVLASSKSMSTLRGHSYRIEEAKNSCKSAWPYTNFYFNEKYSTEEFIELVDQALRGKIEWEPLC